MRTNSRKKEKYIDLEVYTILGMVGGADRKLDSENKETSKCIRRNRKN